MAAKLEKTRKTTGVRARHSRSCREPEGGRCNCRPYWEASVYSKREGKKIRKCFPTQAAAKGWRADALSALNRGKLRAPVRVTVQQAADEWLEGIRAGLIRSRNGRPYKPSTIRSYDWALTDRVLPVLGHVRLSDLRRNDVQDLVDRMLAEGREASTIANTIDPLRAIFRRAVQRDQVAVNPTKDLDVPRREGKRERIASPEEARRLLDALPDSDRALWATALYAGLRRGELRALRWSDIDLDAREIRVSRGWDDKEGAITGKTDAAARTIPILAPLRLELLEHKAATGRRGDDLVFGQTATKPFNPSTVRRRALDAWGWREERKRQAGQTRTVLVKAREDALEPIGLHECRHSFASVMIAAGVNPKAICEAMGHSTIQITFDRYGHLMPGGRDEARERVDAFLSAAKG